MAAANGPGLNYVVSTPFSANRGMVISGDGSAGFRLTGAISGTGGLQKTGLSSVTLASANSYSGTTSISQGALTVVQSGALGSSAAGTDIAAGSSLLLGEGVNYFSAEPLTISGSGAAGSSGALSVADGSATTFSGPITLTGPVTIASGGGSLKLTGSVMTAGQSLLLSGTGRLELSGAISGSGSIISDADTGTTVLSGSNSYSGTTTVSSGVLAITNGKALGSTAGGTVVAANAALQLQGGISVGAEALALSGSGIANDGALRSVSGTNSYAGLLTLNTSTRIQCDADALVLNNTGTISGATFTLTVAGAGNTTIDGVLATTTGKLTKNDSGTLTLSGSNTFSGINTLNAGTLQLTHFQGAGKSTTVDTILTSNTTSGGAVLDLRSNVSGNFGPSGKSGPGYNIRLSSANAKLTINVDNNGAGTGQILGVGNIDTNGSNSVKITVTGSNGYSLSTGNIMQGYNRVTTLNPTTAAMLVASGSLSNSNTSASGITFDGTSSGNAVLGPISGGSPSTSIIKQSTSAWTFYGANTYLAANSITGGLLALSGSATLGDPSNPLTLGGGALDLGATLQTVGPVTLSAVAGSGDTIKNGELSGASFAVSNSSGNAIVSARLSGTGALTKSGTGILTLSSANTYTGVTNLSAGTIKLGVSNALPATTTLDIASTSSSTTTTLDLAGYDQTLAGLKRTSTNSVQVSSVTNSSPTTSTLTLTPASSITFSGRITGNLSLAKAGAGSLTLSGSLSNYTGNTTVTGGTLAIGSNPLSATSNVSLNAGSLSLSTQQTVKALQLNGVWKASGTYNSTNSSGLISGAGSLVVLTGGPVSFAFWAGADQSLSLAQKADAADPNGDGVSNLMAYALGASDPRANARSLLPTSSISGNRLALSFSRNTDRSDINLQVVAADSMNGQWEVCAESLSGGAWTPGNGYTYTETGTGSVRSVQIQDRYPSNDPGHPKRFMLLIVTKP